MTNLKEHSSILTERDNKINTYRRVIIAVSVGLFVYSLTKQCYCTTNQCGDAIMAFLIGWLGVIFGGAALTWLANPLIIISWIMTKRNSKHALTISIVASLFCLSFLLFDRVIDNEAGHYNKIISYQAGYWLWTCSALTMAFGNLYFKLAKSSKYKNAS